MVSSVAGVSVVIGFPVLMMVAMLFMERVEQRTVLRADEPEPTESPDRPALDGRPAPAPHFRATTAAALSVTGVRSARPTLRLVQPLADDPEPDPGPPASVGSGTRDSHAGRSTLGEPRRSAAATPDP
ncbi:MAG: hypothetical protein ACQSGP_01165 [Frankia sp.]